MTLTLLTVTAAAIEETRATFLAIVFGTCFFIGVYTWSAAALSYAIFFACVFAVASIFIT
jgi:hypothetical protein